MSTPPQNRKELTMSVYCGRLIMVYRDRLFVYIKYAGVTKA